MGELLPGQKLDKYRIIRRLAVGGMAEIYLAVQSGLEGFRKYIVIKRVHPRHATHSRFVQMFLDEARLAALLHHHHIAQVYDIGHADGGYFMAMEYVSGHDLRYLLRLVSHRKDENDRRERVPLDVVVGIISNVAAALHYAHQLRSPEGNPLHIIHRDVTPANVIVTFDGGVKLLDFGIAKADTTTQSLAGVVKGKLAYMSPEQCRAEKLDCRSDVFSLGILLFELSTSHRLFKGKDVDLIKRVATGEIIMPSSRVPDFPLPLEQIILKALRPERDKRYQTAEELELALEEFARNAKLTTSSGRIGRYMREVFARERDSLASTIADSPGFEKHATETMQVRAHESPEDLFESTEIMSRTSPTGPTLAQRFLAALPEAACTALRGSDDLDLRLRRLVEQGKSAWPHLPITALEFVEFVAQRAPDESHDEWLSSLVSDDLYLACACCNGDVAAVEAFVERFFPQLDTILAQLDENGDLTRLVKRELHSKLFTSSETQLAKIGEFSGRGTLQSWLKVAATRSALELKRGLQSKSA